MGLPSLTPRTRSPLAQAASGGASTGYTDPFGLLRGALSGGNVGTNPAATVKPAGGPSVTPPSTPTPTPVAPTPQSASTASAPPVLPGSQYDLSTDPVLQQVQASVTAADAAAQANALQQREQLLLSYGDPSVAAAVLGSGDPIVQAAAQNQESTLAQLARARNLQGQQFLEQLDPSLAFSGYRTRQEGQMAQDYQDKLAQAAAGLQSGLGNVSSTLAAALAGGQDKLGQAISDAYSRAQANALANPPAPDSTSSPSGGATPPPGGTNPVFKMLLPAFTGRVKHV